MIYFIFSGKGVYHAFFAHRRTVCRPLMADSRLWGEPVAMLPEGARVCRQCAEWFSRHKLLLSSYTDSGNIPTVSQR